VVVSCAAALAAITSRRTVVILETLMESDYSIVCDCETNIMPD